MQWIGHYIQCSMRLLLEFNDFVHDLLIAEWAGVHVLPISLPSLEVGLFLIF